MSQQTTQQTNEQDKPKHEYVVYITVSFDELNKETEGVTARSRHFNFKVQCHNQVTEINYKSFVNHYKIACARFITRRGGAIRYCHVAAYPAEGIASRDHSIDAISDAFTKYLKNENEK